MATTLFLTNTDSRTHRATNSARLDGTNDGWTAKLASTGRGNGTLTTVTNTVAGATNGVEMNGGFPVEWISSPLSADATISGTITINIWASESSMSANVAINAVIDVIKATDNSIVQIAKSARITELGTSDAVNNFTVSPTSTAVNRGDRLRIRVFGDDAGTMASGFTFTVSWNSNVNNASGDTFVTFTENLTFEDDSATPGGSTTYLTDTSLSASVLNYLTGSPSSISSFAGANENPLSEGGNWAKFNSSGNALQLTSNAATGSTEGVNNLSYWTVSDYGPDLEAYVTISTLAGSAGIFVRALNEGSAGNGTGYLVYTNTAALIIANVKAGGVTTTTLASADATFSNGDKIGIKCTGNRIEAWHFTGGTWNLRTQVTDNTYTAAGKIGLFTGNTSVRMDDFFAGTNTNLWATPVVREAWTSRGSGVVNDVTNTIAGFTTPLQITDTAGGTFVEWYTKRLTAFTLGGLAKVNMRALESNGLANVSLKCEIAVTNDDGSAPVVWGTWCQSIVNAGGEIDLAEGNNTIWVSGDDISVTNGQRLRIRIFLDDISTTAMGASQTATTYYAGTSGGASGDSFVIWPQTLTEFVATKALPFQSRVSRNMLLRR